MFQFLNIARPWMLPFWHVHAVGSPKPGHASMRPHLRNRWLAIKALLLGAMLLPAAARANWIFRPGHFSHHPATGDRVSQYQKPPAAYVPEDPTYVESTYRHKRSGLRVGDSFDFRHTVQSWGEGQYIRPYGEWLFPYRAGATPYGPWGNPQGPWTLPFQSWVNPYGSWNRFGYPSYPPPYAPYLPQAAPYSGPGGGPSAYRPHAGPSPGRSPRGPRAGGQPPAHGGDLWSPPQLGPGPQSF